MNLFYDHITVIGLPHRNNAERFRNTFRGEIKSFQYFLEIENQKIHPQN